jgi:hypothetical protein
MKKVAVFLVIAMVSWGLTELIAASGADPETTISWAKIVWMMLLTVNVVMNTKRINEVGL